MGHSVDHLRDVVELAKKRVHIKPHLRHVDGKVIKVDGYDYLREVKQRIARGEFDFLKAKKPAAKSLLTKEEKPNSLWTFNEVQQNVTGPSNTAAKQLYEKAAEDLTQHKMANGANYVPTYSKLNASTPGERQVLLDALTSVDEQKHAKFVEQYVLIKSELYSKLTDKKTKTSLTKLRNRHTDLHAIIKIAHGMKDGNLDLEWATEALAQIEKRMQNPGSNYGNSTYKTVHANFPRLYQGIRPVVRDYVYDLKLNKDLPFELDIASQTQLIQYIKQQKPDFIEVSALSDDERKNWIRLNVGGWPGKDTYPAFKGKSDEVARKLIEGEAHKRVLISNLKAQMVTGLSTPQDEDTFMVVGESVEAQEEALKRLQIEASLVDAYTRVDDNVIASAPNPNKPASFFHDGEDSWKLIMPDGMVKIRSTNDIVSLLFSDESYKPDAGAGPVPTHIDQLIASIPDPKATVVEWNAWVKEHGGFAVNKMGSDEKLDWALMEVQGNKVGQYQMEAFMASKAKQKEEYSHALWQTPMSGKTYEHEAKTTHPGSPHSPQGAMALQTLSDWIASQEWGESFFNTNIIEEKYAWRPRYKDPGDYKFIHKARSLNPKKGGTAWTPAQIKAAFLDLGLHLGTPYHDDPNGASPKFMKKQVQRWLRWLPEEMPAPKTGGGLAEVKTLDPVDLLDVPKPEGVEEDDWALLMGIESSKGKLFEELDPKLAKFDPASTISALKSSSISNDVKYQLLDAPIYVQKAYMYAQGGLEPQALTQVMPGLREAIVKRAQSGAYAPVYPGGSVTFPWGVHYDILPGDVIKKDPTTGAFLVLHKDGTASGYYPNSSLKKYGSGSPLVVQAKEWWMTWLPSSQPVEVTDHKPPTIHLLSGVLDVPDDTEVWVFADDAPDLLEGKIPQNGVVFVKDGKYSAHSPAGGDTANEQPFDPAIWLNAQWQKIYDPSTPSVTSSVSTPPKPLAKEEAAKALTPALGIMLDYDWQLVQAAEKSQDAIVGKLADASQTLGVWANASLTNVDEALKLGSVHITAFDAPDMVRRLLAWSIDNKDDGLRLLIEWMSSHGHWGHKVAAPNIDPTKSYALKIAQGKTSLEDITSSWNGSEKQEFLKDYGPAILYWHDNAPTFIRDILELINPMIPVDPPSENIAAQVLIFTPDPNAEAMGGSHTKSYWIDQTGRPYMTKSHPSDPFSVARADVEHAANRIGRLHGYPSAITVAQKMPDGEYGITQRKLYPEVPFDTLKIMGYGPKDLTDEQLFQVAEEHVLDWVISNHDSHNDNFIKSPDGKVIHGVDKGQALKHFPKDKLAHGYLPGGNFNAIYYDTIYQGITDGTIPEWRADRLVEHLLKRAKRVALLRDDQHRALLEEATKAFPDGLTPAAKQQGWSHHEFIDKLMERKHNAAYDFEALYKGLYEKAGYTWKLPPVDELAAARIETNQGDVYVGISQELLDDVQDAQVQGVASMFETDQLEDGHLLFWEEKGADGNALFMGEGRFRKKADKTISDWLDHQSVEDKAPTAPKTAAPVAVAATLPYESSWFATIVKAAKTVNTHAADGAYNAGTIAELETVVSEINNTKQAVEAWVKSHPDKPYTANTDLKFVDVHQQQAWLEMVELYESYIKEIQTAKANGAKTYVGSPVFYQAYEYTPKPKAAVEAEFTSSDGNVVLQALADATFIKTVKDTGIQVQVEPKEFAAMLESDDFGHTTTIQTETGPDIKVVRVKNSRSEGVFNPSTGILMHTGGEDEQMDVGWEYDIHAGDITIEYRKHDAKDNVPIAQKGLVRIKIKNFNGQPSKVEEALDLLKMMGVSLEPATEESLELFYWRHLDGIANDRKLPADQKLKDALAAISKAYQTKPGMSPSEELQMLRSRWALYLGKDRVEKAPWMPRFSRPRPQSPNLQGGRPYWIRPDFTFKDVMAKIAPNKWPMENLDYGGVTDAKAIAQTGLLLSTEERTRTLGRWTPKGSSSTDQKSKGSSLFVFNYINQGPGYGGNRVWWSPRALMRTQNYAWDGDKYGNIHSRKDHAPWTLSGFMNTSGELMLKYALSVLDDIDALQFANEGSRQQAIDFYKKLGIDEIRGIPIEERFVLSSGVAATLQKQYALYAEEAAKE